MKILQNLLIALFSIIIFSCGNQKNVDEFVIHGKLSNTHAEKIYLEELSVNDLVLLDSTIINDDGEFVFKYQPEDIGFFIIKISKNNFITLLIDKNNNVELTGDIRQLANTYKVENSEDSKLLWEIENQKRKIYTIYDSLAGVWYNKKFDDNNLEIKTTLDSIATDAINIHHKKMEILIKENKSSLACVIALYQSIGNRFVFNMQDNLELFEIVNNALLEKYPTNMHTLDLDKRITELKQHEAEKKLMESKLDTGLVAPDFTLYNPEKQAISLSSKRGKITLLYFWKSRNTLSRMENPKLVELYNKFRFKGFDIISVSIDDNPNLWLSAVQIDKMLWSQVMANKTVAKIYNIEDTPEIIPRAFLLDQEGEIIAKDFRVDELEILLKDIFD